MMNLFTHFKVYLLFAAAVFLILFSASCGVTQSEYDALKAERDELQAQLDLMAKASEPDGPPQYWNGDPRPSESLQPHVELALPESGMLGLTGEEAAVYDGIAGFWNRPDSIDGCGYLYLPAVAVIDRYCSGNGGEPNYICVQWTYVFIGLGSGLYESPDAPDYTTDTVASGLLTRVSVNGSEADGFRANLVTGSFDGDSWPNGVVVPCGENTELARAFLDNGGRLPDETAAKMRYITPDGPDELLKAYLEYYYG